MIRFNVADRRVSFNAHAQNAIEMHIDDAVAVGAAFAIDNHTLKEKNGILYVNTAQSVEQDNTLPITSAAVYAEVGNINALLATI